MTINDEEYQLNQDFQENIAQLAETLNLDELDSSQLLLQAQEESESLGKSLVSVAIIQFHQRRVWLLDSLRLILGLSLDLDLEENSKLITRELTGLILETKDGPARNGSLYLRKCLNAMLEVEQWLIALAERSQGAKALGHATSEEVIEILTFQHQSLAQQHEYLGAIICLLVKASYSAVEDFFKLLDHMPKVDRWNNLALHYIPILAVFSTEYGSADGTGSLRDARMLNKRIVEDKDYAPWPLRNLQSAAITWWLAEYSGWYGEQLTGSPVQGVDFEAEARARSEAFIKALDDGALECTLSILSQVMPYEWYDPLRSGLIHYLLRDATLLPNDLGTMAEDYQKLMMEQFESFVDAFITNMPDTLRRFKAEEDSQRKKFLSVSPSGGKHIPSTKDLHLERFLMIISFCFENRSEAAQSFWTDTDGNLYGFLQWASRRQTTPTVGAFCEMLRSISKGEECARSAHEFLLEEGSVGTAKIRRSNSLSWAQILGELQAYATKIKEQAQSLRSGATVQNPTPADDINEPESDLMLMNYLRLMAHLSQESSIVRSWILSQQDMSILDIMFQLCNSAVPSRLQASALGVARALLTSGSIDQRNAVWNLMDQWSSGASNPLGLTKTPKISAPSSSSEDTVFAAIAGDFDLMNEFCRLLQSIIEQPLQGIGPDDRLPFPETLGSSYRMPGIEPYIDFVLGKAFMFKANDGQALLQERVLKWHILSFVAASLASFHADLVLLGNKSTTPVDEAMNTSSLMAYVCLHPFSRVMEWMFNDRALGALFDSVHQPVEVVANAPPDSPLLLSLSRGIEVMNLVVDLQSTYLDLVRPITKSESTITRRPISNPSLTSFEDSVALNLELIVDLSLFAGMGNQELAISSLSLLQKLSASRKLNVQPLPQAAQTPYANRLIGALERNDDTERVARSLNVSLEFDPRELEQGPNSSRWSVKSAVLDFLLQCLSASPDRPSLAHALLGFSCSGYGVNVSLDSLFTEGRSLFHGVLEVARDYPDGTETSVQHWAVSIKGKALGVLQLLWSSPMTSNIVIHELREVDFLTSLFIAQRPMLQTLEWEGRSTQDPEFVVSDSADVFAEYLSYRCSILRYASIECRLLTIESIPSLKARVFATLLGSTSLPNGDQVKNESLFDLIDFFEVDFPSQLALPTLIYFNGLDFNAAVSEISETYGPKLNIRLIDEMVRLRYNELNRAQRLQDAGEVQKIDLEAAQILQHFVSSNHDYDLRSGRYQTLIAWADLICLTTRIAELDATSKLALILQAFQLIAPKFEYLTSINAPEALVLARLVESLLSEIDFGLVSLTSSKTGSVGTDRLYQIFRTTIRSVSSPGIDTRLRETLYSTCHRYLSAMSDTTGNSASTRSIIQTVKHLGDRTMDIICDDAYGAATTARVTALILLDSLSMLANVETSDYIIKSMVRTNFLQLLVESIEDIPEELHGTDAKGIPELLVFYEWKFSLLLTISQSKLGSAHLLNAGLFAAVRASGLFSVDPDLGIEINNTEALSKYYKLLLAITKVLVSTVISRGPQNEQALSLTRDFLTGNRPIIVAVFKREAKIGGVSFDDAGISIEELVELFILLIARSDFLEVSLGSVQHFVFDMPLICKAV